MPRTVRISTTVARYWSLLRLIPRAPRKIDSVTLEHLLEEEGFQIHLRSIQRDLESLAHAFIGLQCDRSSKPHGWCWDEATPLLELQRGSGDAAGDAVEQGPADLSPRRRVRTARSHGVEHPRAQGLAPQLRIVGRGTRAEVPATGIDAGGSGDGPHVQVGVEVRRLGGALRWGQERAARRGRRAGYAIAGGCLGAPAAGVATGSTVSVFYSPCPAVAVRARSSIARRCSVMVFGPSMIGRLLPSA